jgi:hypothetical protein
LCDAAPRAFEKFSKVIPGIQKLAETIWSETKARLELESKNQDTSNATQQSYRTTVMTRGQLVAMFLAETTDDIEVKKAALTAASVAASPAVPSKAAKSSTVSAAASESEGDPAASTAPAAEPLISPTKSNASSSHASKSKSLGTRISKMLQEEMRDGGMRAACLNIPGDLKSLAEMKELVKGMLTSQTVADLEEATTLFSKSQEMLKQLVLPFIIWLWMESLIEFTSIKHV